MRRINVSEIKPGMRLAERLVSPRGQVLAEAGTSITAQQLLHASYYGIEEVFIQDEEEAVDKYDYEAKKNNGRSVPAVKMENEGFSG